MQQLRALLVEDSEDDAELVLAALAETGWHVTSERVDTPAAFREALMRGGWDVILSDYTMPKFDAPHALALLREVGVDIPFIVVSGSIGETIAVVTMKAGAQDFFQKGQLARLGSAIERELQEAAVRREGRRVHAELERTQQTFRLMVESARDAAIFMLDADGLVANWNVGAARMTGWSEAEIVGQPVQRLYSDEDCVARRPLAQLRDARRDGTARSEGWRVRKDGSRFWAEESIDRICENSRAQSTAPDRRSASTRPRRWWSWRIACAWRWWSAICSATRSSTAAEDPSFCRCAALTVGSSCE